MVTDIIVALSFFIPVANVLITIYKPKYKVVIYYIFLLLLTILISMRIEPEYYKAEEGNMFYKIVFTMILINVLDIWKIRYKILYNTLWGVVILSSIASAFIGVVEFVYLFKGH